MNATGTRGERGEVRRSRSVERVSNRSGGRFEGGIHRSGRTVTIRGQRMVYGSPEHRRLAVTSTTRGRDRFGERMRGDERITTRTSERTRTEGGFRREKANRGGSERAGMQRGEGMRTSGMRNDGQRNEGRNAGREGSMEQSGIRNAADRGERGGMKPAGMKSDTMSGGRDGSSERAPHN